MPENTTRPEENAPHPAAVVLSANNLRKSFGATRALDGLDLDLLRGESLAIMGPSGSGKSTLLHTLVGIEGTDIGSVHFHDPEGAGVVDITALGESARSRLRRESFGFVSQSGLLILELAVENVAMALIIIGVPRSTALPHAAEWLQTLGLAGMDERRIGQLSGWQAQRVAIARAQVTGATVTLADEPTGALDSATSAEVLQILVQSTIGGGNTLVMVTHDQDVAPRCHRVIHLLDGRIGHHAGASATRPRTHGLQMLTATAYAPTAALLLLMAAGGLSFTTVKDDLSGLYLVLARIAIVLLVVPLAVLGAAAARLSARSHVQRLATVRLLGGTPALAAAVTVIESAAVALAGVLGGIVLYLLCVPLVGLLQFRRRMIGSGMFMPAGVVALLAWVAAIVIITAFTALQFLSAFRDFAVMVAVLIGAFAAVLAVLNVVVPGPGRDDRGAGDDPGVFRRRLLLGSDHPVCPDAGPPRALREPGSTGYGSFHDGPGPGA